MHSQMTFSRQDTSPAFPKFMRTVKGRLPNDKYKIFENTLGFPLATVSFSDTIYKAHHKVFDGRNPVYIVNTTVPDYRIDFQDYRNNTLKLQQMWETVGFEVMKLHINSIAIVDLPAEQTTERPEPFVYFLDIRQKGLLYSHKDGTQLDWIIFEKNNDELCVIDDESYRIYSIDGSGNNKNNSSLGAIDTQLLRKAPVAYGDGISSLARSSSSFIKFNNFSAFFRANPITFFSSGLACVIRSLSGPIINVSGVLNSWDKFSKKLVFTRSNSLSFKLAFCLIRYWLIINPRASKIAIEITINPFLSFFRLTIFSS